jgi:hypothetical protein
MRRSVWVLVLLAFTTSAFAGGEKKAPQEDQILQAVRTESPEQYRKLVALKSSDPERYDRALRRAGEVVALREADPTAKAREEEMRSLHQQIRDLAAGASALDAKALAARRAQIEPLASRLFDLRVAERRAMMDLADGTRDDRRDRLDEKVKDKNAIVDRKIDEMLSGERHERKKGQAEGL